MWLPPTRTLPSGHQPARIPAVESRAQAKAPTKPLKRLKSTVSRRGAARVALDGDEQRVLGGLAGGLDRLDRAA